MAFTRITPYTAIGMTTFNVTYTVGAVDVYLNGRKLLADGNSYNVMAFVGNISSSEQGGYSEYTATDGTTITLTFPIETSSFASTTESLEDDNVSIVLNGIGAQAIRYLAVSVNSILLDYSRSALSFPQSNMPGIFTLTSALNPDDHDFIEVRRYAVEPIDLEIIVWS